MKSNRLYFVSSLAAQPAAVDFNPCNTYTPDDTPVYHTRLYSVINHHDQLIYRYDASDDLDFQIENEVKALPSTMVDKAV